MQKRNLGTTGLQIAPVIFGGNVFGWTIDENTSFRLIDIFTAKGFNCIDTADGYSAWKPGNKGGESETIIGNWIKKSGKRKEVVIATKVGSEISPDKKGLGKKYILKAVEDSLKRLQTDYIDLYQSHKDDLQTPIDETLEAYDVLIKAGKVRYIGASNFSAKRLEDSLKISEEKNLPPYKTLQPQYNLYDRSFEKEYGEVVKNHNLGVITYSSLASGFLTGKYQSEADFSKSVRGQGMKKYMNNKGFKILKDLNEISKKYQCSPSAISLAWLIQNPLVTAPIASATNEAQLAELMQSAEINLTEEDILRLNKAGE
jgi:aryl-alcohol dehydrogenase-like predicted oxidoreductase